MKKHLKESIKLNTPEAFEMMKLVDSGEYRSGDCYISSRRFAIKIRGDYVEGVLIGGYPQRKIRHAWVEKDNFVYDPTIPEAMDKEEYYSVYKAKPYLRTDGITATLKSSKEKRPGPVADMPDGFMEGFKGFVFSETPISDLQLLGQWGPEAKRAYGYNKQDTGILENPKAIEKIHKFWNNSKYDFDFYFIRSYKASKHVEVGQVDPDWVRSNLEINLVQKPDHITVIFTNNRGDEKIPMTAWAMAHRLGHAIRREKLFEEYFRKQIEKDFFEILKYVYGINPSSYSNMANYTHRGFIETEKAIKSLFSAIGKMKSARENILRNSNEFIYELVAQYIITGKIAFNDLPKELVLDRKMAWGRPNYRTKRILDEDIYAEYNAQLHNNAEIYEHYLDSVFGSLVNKIFVM